MLGSTIVALAAAPMMAMAGITINIPNNDFWWVRTTNNTLSWTADSNAPKAFSVWLSNSKGLMEADQKLKTFIRPNCSQFPIFSTNNSVGDGYSIKLYDVLSPGTVYSTSDEFSITAWNTTMAGTPPNVGECAAQTNTSAVSTDGTSTDSATAAGTDAAATSAASGSAATAAASTTAKSSAGRTGVVAGSVVAAAAIALVL